MARRTSPSLKGIAWIAGISLLVTLAYERTKAGGGVPRVGKRSMRAS